MQDLGRVNALIQDAIYGISVVKAFNLQDVLLQKYKAVVGEIEKKGLQIDKHVVWLGSIGIVLRYAPMLIVPLYGGYLTFRGEMTPGDLVIVAGLIAMTAIFILDWCIGLVVSLVGAITTFSTKAFVGPLQRTSDRIQKHLGISKLLLGFYPLECGNIGVNGKSIEQYSLTRLRELMAYLPQDAYLFDATIEENIRYGRPDATKDEVIAAAKAAKAHDFIMEQPDTYNAVVGEQGAKLSGGQRQRIAIARALLKDATILLLDEATSALDSEADQIVQEALTVLMRGRTTIAIAHRLSTVENADKIYVIDGGRVIEQGTLGPNLLVEGETIQFNQDSDHLLDVGAFATLAAADRGGPSGEEQMELLSEEG